MPFYRDHICPYLVDILGDPAPVQKVRRQIIPLAYGDVLEIGPGSGANFLHYDLAKVNKLYALEPNPEMIRLVDWHPFDYFTLDYPFGARSNHLEPLSNETRLNIYTKLKASLHRWLSRILAWLMDKMTKAEQGYDLLVWLIEEEANSSGKDNDDQNRP